MGIQTIRPASCEICMNVRKQQLEPNMEQKTASTLGKESSRLYIVTLLILHYYYILITEYIMQNARLAVAQARIKIAGRNINNLRYADDTTLMAGSKEMATYSIILAWRIPWTEEPGVVLSIGFQRVGYD